MTWTLTNDPAAFRAEAGAFLAAHPADNTVLLTLLDRIAKLGPHAFGDRDPVFGHWRAAPDGPVEGVFAQTPPFPVRLGRMPAEAAAELARALHEHGREVSGVGGERAAAEAFAAAWPPASAGAVRAGTAVDERLYRLADLADPSPVPAGTARPAGPADREQLVEWSAAFLAEIGETNPVDHGAYVDGRLAEGGLHVWEDGGRPVSFAGSSPVIAGMSRIGPVFTPVALRGRGYASGVVAAASAHALAAGAAEVLLYTDLANPVSNSIYQKLGYRPVADHVTFDFTAG
ncbi:GNAT family N-acetyltransferase [Kitasatospora sp. DSM 101779]|uniref:GNAT family N-acetyltransferase n=1 Tax=Kitasatospora sp. DSM 101779 TaxID=2853165 RepID=UPI0021D88584|nr:GNAT family N-acetyltransferase [Kitasatospora sp. DSM 101779]MCU7823086.1 GNAT family N-acetyltransferase [Kitasatospora sp. DSM 101779]